MRTICKLIIIIGHWTLLLLLLQDSTINEVKWMFYSCNTLVTLLGRLKACTFKDMLYQIQELTTPNCLTNFFVCFVILSHVGDLLQTSMHIFILMFPDVGGKENIWRWRWHSDVLNAYYRECVIHDIWAKNLGSLCGVTRNPYLANSELDSLVDNNHCCACLHTNPWDIKLTN